MPGIEAKMRPLPEVIKSEYHSGFKLAGKAAIITGGDSGIGRAVAVAFAKEGRTWRSFILMSTAMAARSHKAKCCLQNL